MTEQELKAKIREITESHGIYASRADKVQSACLELINEIEASHQKIEDELRGIIWEKNERVNSILRGEYWMWQGDDEDHLESLVCPIVIRPDQLKDLIREAVKQEREKEAGFWNLLIAKHLPDDEAGFIKQADKHIAALRGEEVKGD